MSIEKERKAFEAWLKSLNENGRTTYFLGQESTVAWEAWQASANRDGYKLVPVEPSKDVLLLMCDEVADCTDINEMHRAYKAMIGACDD